MAIEQTQINSWEQAVLQVNQGIKQDCESRKITILSDRPCGSGANGDHPVELVILIYSDRSMGEDDKPLRLQEGIDKVIAAVQSKCPGQLKANWFGIDGEWDDRWPNSKFEQSYRSYMFDKGIIEEKDTDLLVVRYSNRPRVRDKSAGAGAVMDIANYFDWQRPDSSKAIFLLGDTWLGRIEVDGQTIKGNEAIDRAIAAANNQKIRVFCCCTDTQRPKVMKQYRRLAAGTNAEAYFGTEERLTGFENFLEEALCQPPELCNRLDIPELRPCFELRWGQQEDARLSPNGTEVLYVVASNPYANVTFKDLMVKLSVSNQAGEPIMPGPTSSISVVPTASICFGDIPPCDPKKPEALSYIAREAVLVTNEATSTDYFIDLDYSFSAELTVEKEQDRIKLQLV